MNRTLALAERFSRQTISGSFTDFTSTYGAPDAAAMLSISVRIAESAAGRYRQHQTPPGADNS